MGIDASIYSNVKQPEPISPIDNAQKAMTLSSLGMQQAQMQRQVASQRATQQALMDNTDQNGNLNTQGALSALGKQFPDAAMALKQHLTAQDEATAKSQTAQAESLQARASAFANGMNYVAGVSEQDKPQAYENTIKQFKASHIITPDQGIPDQYDPILFRGLATAAMQHLGQGSKDYLTNQKTQAETGEISSRTNKVQVDRLTEYQKMAEGSDEIKKPTAMLSMGKNANSVIDDALGNQAKGIPGNPASRAAVPVFLARFTTAGQRMNEQEITPQEVAKGTFGEKLKQMYSDAKNGTFTQASADYAKQFISSQMGSIAGSLSDAKTRYAKMYSNASGMDLNSAHQALFSSAPGSMEQTPASPARFAGGKSGNSGGGFSLEKSANAGMLPKIGDVETGKDGIPHVYMGGDPSKPASWKKR